MKYIECPDQYSITNPFRMDREHSVFMAGGITDCPNWQQDFRKLLENEPDSLVLLNPRRGNFNVREDGIAEEQIHWEHNHLAMSSAVSFWFPSETLCPITLFELGKIGALNEKPIFVGTHPDYKRKVDILIQMPLLREGVTVVHSLEDLAQQVSDWLANPYANRRTRQIY